MDARVTRAMAPAREVLASLGCALRDRDPDMTGAEDAFRTWRAWYYALTLGETLRNSPHDGQRGA